MIISEHDGFFTITIKNELGRFSEAFTAIETCFQDNSVAFLVNHGVTRQTIQIADGITFWTLIKAHRVPIVYVSQRVMNTNKECAA